MINLELCPSGAKERCDSAHCLVCRTERPRGCEDRHNSVCLAAQPSVPSRRKLTSDEACPTRCWNAQAANGQYEADPKLFLGGWFHALTLRNGNCRKLHY